ncbi:glycosyl hydrolase 2 galactose-binding domain-containing protein [Arsenicicoccus dermatophilus]|uniref:glycosyl hydrolase 2 galactose-binding domain-containing protein n=1 Tax=Arsenicicoccus dermatophilus TaxID=1076331 RepID=UPI0039175138
MVVEIRWELQGFGAGEVLDPADLPATGWVPATVPGSLAASPAVVERYGEQVLADADHRVWWWRGAVDLAAPLDTARLVLDRLATHADVYLDGARVLRSDNAFRRHVVDLGPLAAGPHAVGIRLASWDETATPRTPRARWRSALVPDATIRWRRTPVLGRIPTWAGALPPVGVLGTVRVEARPAVEIASCRTRLEDSGRGTVDVAVRCDGPREVTVQAAGEAERTVAEQTADGDWIAAVHLTPPAPATWWPHTHGEPILHELLVHSPGVEPLRRRIGFSRITARRDEGRFGLVVGGVDVFVRGVVWAHTDPRGWTADPQAVARDLDALVAAGLNLVRVPGTGTYADEVLRELAAERGLLVWQDAMLATFDPPEDEGWLAELEAELRDRLIDWQGWPHLAVVCGGTETEQQPTLMGLPAERRRMTAVHDVLPRLAAELVPGAVHITASPSGGPRPVSIAHGVSHYFGVGAYLRPLEDARTAQVSFASEALAFAIPPETSSMTDAPAGRGAGSPWREAAPHDRGTTWDFVDVTDHYVPVVADAERIAEDVTDAEAWEDLQRAAATAAITETLAAWRSGLTPTAGGIVLAHRDLAAGPGWGLLDASGAAKAPLLALRDVLAPVALLLVDRGLDGLLLEAVNDAPAEATGSLLLAAQDRAGNTVLDAGTTLTVPAHGRATVEVEELLGGFRDLGWAWRFGEEPGYACVSARWRTAGGDVRATRALVPLAPRRPEPDVTAQAITRYGVVRVTVTAADHPVVGVHATAPGWVADTGWWPLAAGDSRDLHLRPLDVAGESARLPAYVTVSTLTGPPVTVPVEGCPHTD